MKKILFLCLLFLLSGCQKVIDWRSDFQQNLVWFESEENSRRANVNNRYFSYYLPADMQRKETVETSAILNFENNSILMSMNIGNIIHSKGDRENLLMDEDFYRHGKRVYHREGEFLTTNKERHRYLCEVYSYHDQYLLSFLTKDFRYYSYTNEQRISELFRHILQIAKSMDVLEEEVIKSYSDDVVIDYHKKQVDLFKTIIPRNGQLKDIVLDKEVEEKTNEEAIAER